MVQVVEHMCNRYKALSSNPSTTEREREERERQWRYLVSIDYLVILPSGGASDLS
jgi:hypothetical protein